MAATDQPPNSIAEKLSKIDQVRLQVYLTTRPNSIKCEGVRKATGK